jgi:hypothetical protein
MTVAPASSNGRRRSRFTLGSSTPKPLVFAASVTGNGTNCAAPD